MKQPAVYLLASQPNGTLYIGVTSNLSKRIYEHKSHAVESFSAKYHTHLLVWYELHNTMESAILREKAIKKWHRNWKLRIIEEFNPQWKDLYEDIV
ncbi:MAG: GIY-YIG nuclease family protein [Sulfuricurvum sp.]